MSESSRLCVDPIINEPNVKGFVVRPHGRDVCECGVAVTRHRNSDGTWTENAVFSMPAIAVMSETGFREYVEGMQKALMLANDIEAWATLDFAMENRQ